jgi:UDP-N-acetylmuramoylalanine-D-glutamate ligase
MKQHAFVCGADEIHGGLATINWLLDHGMKVTVTGVQDASEKEKFAKRIDEHLKRVARDGKAYEKMSARLSWSPNARTHTVNVQDLFVSEWKKRIIAITGAHGKTMTAVWAGHLIGDCIVAGHFPERPLLSALDSKAKFAVIELHDEIPSAKNVHFVSTDKIGNLEAAIQAARLAGVSEECIQRRIASLPQVPARQEVIHTSAKLTTINDAMATVPERGIATLQKFGGPTCICIAGGDGRCAYKEWAAEVKKSIRPTNMILLEGTATRKMRAALGAWGRGVRMYETFDDAMRVAKQRAQKFVSATILFSPAAQGAWKDLKFVIK